MFSLRLLRSRSERTIGEAIGHLRIFIRRRLNDIDRMRAGGRHAARSESGPRQAGRAARYIDASEDLTHC